MIKEGDLIPEFTLMSDKVGEVSSKNLFGKRYVLYIYPQDETSGCTIEAQEFRDRIPEFTRLDVEVYGLSPDDLDSHCRFSDKHQLNFPLLVDTGRRLIDQMGLYGERESEGRKFMGIFRTTMIVGPDGRIEKLWEKVKAKDHAEEVLKTLKEMLTTQAA